MGHSTGATNTYQTFETIGAREDLSDTIYLVSPKTTPFLAAIGTTSIHSFQYDWQTDLLAVPRDNAHVEGADFEAEVIVATVRPVNRTQIFMNSLSVSDTNEVVKKAGRGREMARELIKGADELKTDIEKAFTGNQTPTTGTNSVAGLLRPLPGWYTTNVSDGGGSAANGNATTARVAGTSRPFTEGVLKDNLELVYNAGGTPDVCMVGTFNRRVFSTFDGGAMRTDKSEDARVTATVRIYESDWGPIMVVPNRIQRAEDAHNLDTSMWKNAVLRPMKTVDIAKQGDNTKAFIVSEVTLEASNQAASGLITDLTTS